jgi:ASCH domain
MKALSIRHPWAWLIVHAGKDIENRRWYTHYRGPFLIHAAKGMTAEEREAAARFVSKLGIRLPDTFERGGLIGQATLIDCVKASDSPWFFGRYGFVIRDVKPLPFQPMRGQLGFFDV